MACEPGQDGVEDLAADIVEVHVHPVRTALAQRGADVLALVVDRRVEAELLDDEPALLRPACDPDDPATLDLRDLSDQLAHRPRRRGDHHGFTRDRPSDLEQTEIRGHAGHPQDAQIARK